MSIFCVIVLASCLHFDIISGSINERTKLPNKIVEDVKNESNIFRIPLEVTTKVDSEVRGSYRVIKVRRPTHREHRNKIEDYKRSEHKEENKFQNSHQESSTEIPSRIPRREDRRGRYRFIWQSLPSFPAKTFRTNIEKSHNTEEINTYSLPTIAEYQTFKDDNPEIIPGNIQHSSQHAPFLLHIKEPQLSPYVYRNMALNPPQYLIVHYYPAPQYFPNIHKINEYIPENNQVVYVVPSYDTSLNPNLPIKTDQFVFQSHTNVNGIDHEIPVNEAIEFKKVTNHVINDTEQEILDKYILPKKEHGVIFDKFAGKPLGNQEDVIFYGLPDIDRTDNFLQACGERCISNASGFQFTNLLLDVPIKSSSYDV